RKRLATDACEGPATDDRTRLRVIRADSNLRRRESPPQPVGIERHPEIVLAGFIERAYLAHVIGSRSWDMGFNFNEVFMNSIPVAVSTQVVRNATVPEPDRFIRLDALLFVDTAF